MAVCALALLRGGRSERILAAAMLLDFVIVFFLANRVARGTVQLSSFLGEVVVLVAALWIVVETLRPWTFVAAGAQTLSVLTYPAKYMEPSISGETFVWAKVLLGYVVLASLLWGLIEHWRARR